MLIHFRKFFAVILILVMSNVVQGQTPSQPIPDTGQPEDQQLFFGAPAGINPIVIDSIPSNPSMLASENNNMHNDTYMSDTYSLPGPLGISPQVSSVDLGAVCATITFDSNGHLITACLSLTEAHLYVLDVDTLDILDVMELPYRLVSLTDLEFPPGSYFYLDENEQIILPVVGNEIWVLAVNEQSQLNLIHIFDLKSHIPEDDDINSVLPDFDGILWFTTRNGIVGTLDPDTEVVEILELEGELIVNSFAVDETNGVFIVSNHALYRFDTDESHLPIITWRELYDRGTEIKPGQVSQGSGTTPTIMGEQYVVITDNAEPQMNVLVYQRAVEIGGDERLVCAIPVFPEGRSATENSIIATNQSIIVENNYGYVALQAAMGILSEPGLIRIDVIDNNCEIIWTSSERIPTAVSKLSVSNGLIYTYTREEGNINTATWLFTAIDFVSGDTIWERYVGTGSNFNNSYAGVYLHHDGTIYVGVLGGIVVIRDAE